MTERSLAHINEGLRPTDFVGKNEPTQPTSSRFIYGVGNHENKALLYIAMAEMAMGQVSSENDLQRLMEKIQGKRIVWQVSAGTLYQYCERSFYPAGLVGIVPFGKEKERYAFKLLDRDTELAESFAGHSLEISLEHLPSLQDLWEPTSRALIYDQINPPPTRLGIFTTLLDSDLPVRSTDIASRTHKSRGTIGRNLKQLKDKVISFESVTRGDPIVYHRLSAEALKLPKLPDELTKPSRRSLSHLVYDVVYQNQFQGNADWLTAEDTVDIIIENNEHYENNVTRKSLLQQVRVIYKHFEREGLVEVWDFEAGKFTKVDLSSSQHRALSDLLELLRKFQEGDPEFIAEGIMKARTIINDEKKVQKLVAKARAASSHV